jgi:hypothetical protein
MRLNPMFLSKRKNPELVYSVTEYDEKQYRVLYKGITYDTNEAEFLGFMPVFGSTIELYRDSEGRYFTLSFTRDLNKKPGFSRMPEGMAKAWIEGMEKYWAAKQV